MVGDAVFDGDSDTFSYAHLSTSLLELMTTYLMMVILTPLQKYLRLTTPPLELVITCLMMLTVTPLAMYIELPYLGTGDGLSESDSDTFSYT